MKKRHVCFLSALGVFAAVFLALTDTAMAQSKPSHRKPPEGMVSGPGRTPS